MLSVIFFYRINTMWIWFATYYCRSFITQSVFDESPLIASNINNNIIFF